MVSTELYLTKKKNIYLAGDIIDVVAVQQLGRDGQRDVVTLAVIVFLFVPQLEGREEKRPP